MSPGFSPRRHHGFCGPRESGGSAGESEGSRGPPFPPHPAALRWDHQAPSCPAGAWCGASLTSALGLKASKLPSPSPATAADPLAVRVQPRVGPGQVGRGQPLQVLRDCRPRQPPAGLPLLKCKMGRIPSPGGEGARAQAGSLGGAASVWTLPVQGVLPSPHPQSGPALGGLGVGEGACRAAAEAETKRKP